MQQNVGGTMKYTKNRKKIADFLGANGCVSAISVQKYDELFAADYKYPVKTSVYKLISAIFIILSCCVMLFTPRWVEWAGLLVNVVLVAISIIAFNFVRNIKYPNEQYEVVFVVASAIISTTLIVLGYFGRSTLMFNLFLLNKFQATEIVSTVNIFMIVACILSVGALIYGILMGKRRFGTIMTPLITLGGLLMFAFIANLALDEDFLIKISESNTVQLYSGVKMWLLDLVLVAALLSMIAYDIGIIHISKAVGGEQSYLR